MIKIKQVGNNLLVQVDGESRTIKLDGTKSTDKLFALAFKANDGSNAAKNLFNKELDNLDTKAKKEVNTTRVEKNLLKKKIKSVASLDIETFPIDLPEDWSELLKDNKHVKNFLIWLSLNDNTYTRNNFLYHFNSKTNYITPNGFIVSLRRVWKNNTGAASDPLYEFVQSSFVKVKGWKKAPKNYGVYHEAQKDLWKISTTDPDNADEKWDFEGNLQYLKDTLKEPEAVQTYTSDYAKRYLGRRDEWKVGDVVEIHDKTTSTAICGINQLHIRSNPIEVANSTGYGDTCIITIVNPKDVINISEGWKYTTSRMYIAAVVTPDEIHENFTETFGKFDFDYLNIEMKDILALEAKIKLKELSVRSKEFKALNNKVDHLPEELYEEIIKNRIQLVNNV